jgi:putative SOS response-associated peptidase YedK
MMAVEAMRRLFDVVHERASLGNMEPLRAIFPKYDAPIVTVTSGERSLKRSHWGFLTPNKSKKTGKWLKPSAWNNTRDDKIRTSGLWKHSFSHRRCLIPATAYAEATGRNPATYHWFGFGELEGFALAGIFKHQNETVGDTEVDTIVHSMVTTNASEFASQYHNRMPVILDPADYETWLRGTAEDATKLLRPWEAELTRLGGGIGVTKWPQG